MPRGIRLSNAKKLQRIDAEIEELDNRIKNINENKANLLEERKQIELQVKEEKVGGLLEIMEEKNISADQLLELLVTAPQPNDEQGE